MNEPIKLQKNYDPEKLRSSITKMEQFFAISVDEHIDEQRRKAAKGLFEHYRRLAMCILAKEIDPKIKIDRIFPAKMVDLVYEEYNQKVQVPNA